MNLTMRPGLRGELQAGWTFHVNDTEEEKLVDSFLFPAIIGARN